MFAALGREYGSALTVNLPGLGKTVVISDPVLVKDLFTMNYDLIERPKLNNLSALFGPGSMFSLAGDELVERRRLLLPAFHSKRIRGYEHIIEEEVMRETANWPQGREFETLQPLRRIVLTAVLRAAFGAEGPALDELRELIPPAVKLGFRILPPVPPIVRRDLGPWSPRGRFLRYRCRIDAVVESLIADTRTDPTFEERSDVLALLLKGHCKDGGPVPDQDIADELLTMVVASLETTAAALAWAVERLRRDQRLMLRLTAEVDAGGSELRQATIREVLRTRPPIVGLLRRTKARIRLGDWVIPEDSLVLTSIDLAHESEESFPDTKSFKPDRFVDGSANPFAWIPFGGGLNRCFGAAFATMEMDATLRILLREFNFAPTDAPGERPRKGFARPPRRGGRAVVYRRTAGASSDAESASVTNYGNGGSENPPSRHRFRIRRSGSTILRSD